MRDHNPVVVEELNGLFKRGDVDSVPLDHFSDCDNIRFEQSSVLTRYGIGPDSPYKNVTRLYVFNQSLLILDIDGNIYHNDRANRYVPILHIDGMTDFSCVKFADRVYITPIGVTDFIYVYKYGDTAGARKAAGSKPSSAPTATIGGAGNVEQGIHIFAVVYETVSGFLTKLSDGVSLELPDGTTSVNIGLPVSPSSFVVARWVVATISIKPPDFTGDLTGYQFFFVTRINNNTDTSTTVNFYDAELEDDASHLEDLYEEIPNCQGLNIYHNRLVGWHPTDGTNRLSDVLVSESGEPEAIDKVDGLISIQPDGKSITYCQEYRDILYVFKQTKTVGFSDNDDVPSTWKPVFVDQGIGSQTHGVATIMDSGGVNIEFLLVGDYTGLIMFDGKYNFPELTWKVEDIWTSISRIDFNAIQIVVQSQSHEIFAVLPDGSILYGDYANGLNWKDIRWTPHHCPVKATSVVIVEEGGIRVVIGTKEVI